MNNNNSTGVSYVSGFFILIGIALLGLVAASLAGGALLVAKTGLSAVNLEKAARDPANAGLLRLIQGLSVVFGMLLPTLITARILNRRPLTLLGTRREMRLRQVGLVLAIAFLSMIVAVGLGWINKQIPISATLKASFDKAEKDYGDQVAIMMNLKTIGGYLSSLFLIAFLPALCEELLFRAGLQNFLTRATRKPALSILIVSILFSVIHFSYYGFLPRLYLGIMLGLIFYLSGSIWLSALAHFINNGIAVTGAFIMTRQGKPMDEIMKSETPGVAQYWGLLAIPLVVLLFRALKKAAPPTRDALEITNPNLQPEHGL